MEPIEGIVEDVAEATLQRHPISLGARIHWGIGRFEVGGAVALVADYVSTERRPVAGSDFEREGPDGYGDVLLGTELRVAWSPVRRLWLCIAFGAEIIIYSGELEVRDATTGEHVLLLQPWVFQPYVRLGLQVDLF
jgi:hypothetical protein